MIVACTGCSAKFKVADEKVGAKGAKLRCSKCGTVFMVRHDEPAAPAPAPPPAPAPEAAPEPFFAPPDQAPPPLPRRGSSAASFTGVAALQSTELGAPVDARSAFEIDLEPAAPRGVAEPDPFAPPPSDDPFAVAAAAAPPPAEPEPPAQGEPFAVPPADPFAAVQAPIPPELLHASPTTAAGAPEEDPFASALPPLGGISPAGDLALEDRDTPPPRAARPQSSAPMDDPFGAPEEGGQNSFDGGHPGDIPPMSHDLPGDPFGAYAQAGPAVEAPAATTPPPRREAPIRVDPFAAAAVDADPLQVGGPAPQAAPTSGATEDPGEATGVRSKRTLARLRSAAVNAISLLLLLVVALALLVVWRGEVPIAEAVHPSTLLSALIHRQRAPAPFTPRHVTSGHYDRAGAPPVLFVRGEVVSSAPAPVAGVRVAVELVKDGAVVARGEALAGALLTPEELHGAADAAALARAAEAAAARTSTAVAPGQALPFLVTLADAPDDLAGVALRIRADREGGP